MAKAAPPTRSVEDKSELDYLIAEYIHLRDEEKGIAARKKNLRDQLMALVERDGEFDSNGNQFIELPPGSEVEVVQRQRRTSRSTDIEEAHRILADKGMEEQAFVMVPTLDEEFVWKQVFEGRITDDELDEIFPVKETYALVVQ